MGGISWLNDPTGKLKGVTWNPFVGCTKIRPGCKNCYAAAYAGRLRRVAQGKLDRGKDPGPSLERYLDVADDGGWAGEIVENRESYDEPLRWRNPRLVFFGSMTDVGHRNVTADMLLRALTTIVQCPESQFVVLTKRPGRLAKFLTRSGVQDAVYSRVPRSERSGIPVATCSNARRGSWRPRNLLIGISAHDQGTFERRWRALAPLIRAGWPVAISLEPLLGPVDLHRYRTYADSANPSICLKCGRSGHAPAACHRIAPSPLSWIMVGSETGVHARPMELQWARDIVAACRDRFRGLIPLHVKQVGRQHAVRLEALPEGLRIREWPREWKIEGQYA